MSQITGAEIVFKAFADHGVEYIFVNLNISKGKMM